MSTSTSNPKIDSLSVLTNELAAIILDHIDARLRTIVHAEKRKAAIETEFGSSSAVTFIEKAIRDDNSTLKFKNAKGIDVHIVHPVTTSFMFKEIVDDNYDATELRNFLTTNPEAQLYNLSSDDIDSQLKNAKGVANRIIKLCCEYYSHAIHKEYMGNYQLYVEFLTSDKDFGVMAYYSTDANSNRAKVIALNEARYGNLANKDARKFQNLSSAAKDFNERLDCYMGTGFEDLAKEAVSVVVATINDYGKNLAELGKNCKLIRGAKGKPAKLKAPNQPNSESEPDNNEEESVT